MDSLQYEARECAYSEDAARVYLATSLPEEDECILLCKASEVLDEFERDAAPERRGLERFSLLLLRDDALAGFLDKVRSAVTEFEDKLFERDRMSALQPT